MAKRKINTTRNEEAWGYRSPWWRGMNFFQRRFGNGQDLKARLLGRSGNKNKIERDPNE